MQQLDTCLKNKLAVVNCMHNGLGHTARLSILAKEIINLIVR